MIAAACGAVPFLVLAWCGAWVLRSRRGGPPLWGVARHHLARCRYAWRMRGPLPARDQGIPYDKLRWLEALDAWEAPAARTDRSRT